jgi:hypothetical protein
MDVWLLLGAFALLALGITMHVLNDHQGAPILVAKHQPKTPKPIDRWLGIGIAIVSVILYLLPKTIPVVIGCVVLMFVMGLHPLWNFWWIEERLWRRITALVMFSSMLLIIGIKAVAPEKTGSTAVSVPTPASSPAVPAVPAGFVRFLGQVIDGYAPMMQENQTDAPLDNVQLQVIESVPNSETDWDHGIVVWQKDIEIGTCRARLTTGLPDRFPVGGQKRLFFHIFMMTRLQTYRETMKLVRTSNREYAAELNFYRGGDLVYAQTMMVGIAETERRTKTNGAKPHGPSEEVPREKPDIMLGLTSPKEFLISMLDNSNVVLRDPKYELGIADLDVNDSGLPKLLPIPVSNGDWIRPHEALGPNFIFTPTIKEIVKPGHRLFGFGMVLCPECKVNRCYWIYAVFGQDGWYSAMPDGFCPDVTKLMGVMQDVRDKGDTYLNSLVPPAIRTPIGQLAPRRLH